MELPYIEAAKHMIPCWNTLWIVMEQTCGSFAHANKSFLLALKAILNGARNVSSWDYVFAALFESDPLWSVSWVQSNKSSIMKCVALYNNNVLHTYMRPNESFDLQSFVQNGEHVLNWVMQVSKKYKPHTWDAFLAKLQQTNVINESMITDPHFDLFFGAMNDLIDLEQYKLMKYRKRDNLPSAMNLIQCEELLGTSTLMSQFDMKVTTYCHNNKVQVMTREHLFRFMTVYGWLPEIVMYLEPYLMKSLKAQFVLLLKKVVCDRYDGLMDVAIAATFDCDHYDSATWETQCDIYMNKLIDLVPDTEKAAIFEHLDAIHRYFRIKWIVFVSHTNSCVSLMIRHWHYDDSDSKAFPMTQVEHQFETFDQPELNKLLLTYLVSRIWPVIITTCRAYQCTGDEPHHFIESYV